MTQLPYNAETFSPLLFLFDKRKELENILQKTTSDKKFFSATRSLKSINQNIKRLVNKEIKS